MKVEKYNTLFSRLAGGIALFSWVIAFFISGIPNGYISIAKVIEDLIEISDAKVIVESSIWILVCLTWLFAGISLLIANPNLSSAGMIIFGAVFLVYEIISFIIFNSGLLCILNFITPIAIILAGLSILIRKEPLYYVSIFLGIMGAFMYGIYRINQLMLRASDYVLEGEMAGRVVQAMIWAVVYFLLAAVVVLSVLACHIRPKEPVSIHQSMPLQSHAQMRRCPRCGAPFSPDSRFCGNCGRPLT